ncbi:uncharacterized protein LAESUDRAFT_108540 [Laetiporus sulphureus 93-53]|uniref:Nnf1-domain-containing protein n=1 Tax=Laetiporus sulphureus 93-53 TaxID=1314785 RepID=A0A165EMM7_9APHY|nr:uncharacterized protein LAESUDRAFT_108540 [Laetiporus sulphureus 93-53]KZT07379.1 hypothetical protein LAESUDRAFT_108540 [Laetiporus sulphureus 93-53]
MTESNASSSQQPSKRWAHFHSALQLAIQRSAHKWTYADFTECFPLWCEEQPENAPRIFATISKHMDDSITEKCEELLKKYNVRENIDNLHAVVTEARVRKHSGGYNGPDVWRENLHPGAAVRARTIPLLEKERDRLRAELEELDKENLRLQGDMQRNVEAREQVDAETSALLDMLDEIEARWSQLPLDEVQAWTLQTAESKSSTRSL